MEASACLEKSSSYDSSSSFWMVRASLKLLLDANALTTSGMPPTNMYMRVSSISSS